MQLDEAGMLEGLTEAQAEAVRHVDGPLLVLAGPGSGKTTVVTRRIAWLLRQGIPPWQVLALTFTNKAAREMRERVEAIVGQDLAPRGLTVATFHGFCARLLRRYADAAGVDSGYTIYDTADQRAAAKRAIAEAGLNERNFPPAAVLAAISSAKNRLEDAATFAESARDFHSRSIGKAYRAYEKLMRSANAVDFDDLLLRVALLLRRDESVRTELQERYRYLLIDEYQDTNNAQFTIARGLADRHRNVMVVGDPDQSIYAWRGADIRNILEFEAVYPEARVVPLGRNFRSTAHIVGTADVLIRNNTARKDKRLFTELGEGERPVVETCDDEHAEAGRVVDAFRRHHAEDGIPYREMAVLYRTNALSRVMEDAMRHAHLPYVIARGTAFYDRKEIRDALAYLRLVVNAGDDVALRRIVNVPTRGIGRTTLDRVEAHAAAMGSGLGAAMNDAEAVPGLAARAKSAVTKFAEMVEGWRSAAEVPAAPGDQSLPDLVEQVIRESGLENALRTSATEEDLERLENLSELVTAASEFLPAIDEDPGPIGADGRPGPSVADPADVEAPSSTPSANLDDDGLDMLFGDLSEPEDEAIGAAAAGLATPDADGRVPVRALLAAFLEQIALVSDADAVDPERGAITLMTLHAAKGLEFDSVAIIGLEEGLLPHVRSIESPSDEGLEEERRLLFVGVTRARRRLLVTTARSRAQRGFRERTIESRFLRELPEEHIRRIDPEPPFGGHRARGGGAGSADPFLAPSDDFPGWEHAQVEARDDGGVRAGALVRHPTFGLGRIESISGRRHGGRALVEFERVGRKTLILDHARLEVVDPTEFG